MKSNFFLVVLITFFVFNIQAQTGKKEVLFLVDNEPVYTSDFIRVYNKNLDLVQDESQKDVEEYLKLFTNYKLKLKAARAEGLHEKESYVRELGNYKKELTKGFITDTKVTDALVEEAYERMSYDVKADHILIKVLENASPQDTLAAYNKILKLRERAVAEGFDVVRKEVHNGKTIYGEKLGYFSGFKMVYKFESVAFKTEVGTISMPFRTSFGYHIIHVQDKQKSKGERTVAHIMVVKKTNDSLAEKPENRIQEIYKKINQGEDFEALAKQFSDDKSSASKGGKLAPFSKGQINAEVFEKEAFNLKNVGDVSKPIQTKYGWHIIKLYDKKPIPPFDLMKAELKEKVKRDSRSKLIDEAFNKKLRDQYKIEINEADLDYFASILNNSYLEAKWSLPDNFENEKTFFKIEQRPIKYKQFADYLLKTQRYSRSVKSFKSIVSQKYDTFLNSKLLEYKEDNLENESEEFSNILSEYREGLLLFDLMETNIWNASKTDSTEIKTFYDANKSKYIHPERIRATVASSGKQKVLKKVSKLLKQETSLDEIKKQVNTENDVQVIFTSDIMAPGHQTIPDNFKFKKGISKIYKHNDAFVLVKVKEVLPKTQKTFEEAKGSVISDYQNYKEEKWIKALSETYKVEVNNEVFAKVKSQINNR